MTIRKRYSCVPSAGALCAAVAAAFAPVASAQNGDGASASCSVCSISSGWELDFSGGLLGASGDELFRFGDYRGIDDSGVYATGDLFARYRGEDAEFFHVEGYRLGLDSQSIFAEGGRQGLYEVRASYQGIPRRIYDTTETPYRLSGDEELNLLNGWVRAGSTQGMTQLAGSLETVDIERDWNIYQFGVALTPISQWTFDVNYRRQERDGNTVSAGSFYFDSTMFAAPVNDTTDELELSALYEAERWQASVSYWGAFFDNGISSLTWDNPYSPIAPGADSGRMARAPSNDAHQIRVAGSAIFPARTTLVGHLSFGLMEQDESFLPYTINSLIGAAMLPSQSAEAEVETTNFGLRLTSSPARKFTVEGDLRYNERDNRTSERVFSYVITDLFDSVESASNVAYDYERSEFRLRGEYRILSRLQLNAGYDIEQFTRSSQERNETDTDRLWVQLRTRAIPRTNLDVELYSEDRDGSSYIPITDVTAPQNPLMRKYNMADRERDGVKGNISAFATERINIGLNGEFTKDDYEQSVIGLRESDYLRYGVDGSYTANSGMSVYGALYREEFETEQANSQTFSTPDWIGTTDDSFFTASFGLNFPNLIGGWDFNAQYAYTDAEGETENDTSGLESEFPEFESNLHQFRVGFDYRVNQALSLQLKYMYEKFDAEDWTLEGVSPATVPNLLSLGADPWNYDAHMLFLSVQYVLDTRGQAGARIPR